MKVDGERPWRTRRAMTVLSPVTIPRETPVDPNGRSTGTLFSYRRTLWLTVVMLAVVNCLAVLAFLDEFRIAGIEQQMSAWAACGLLVSASIAMLLIGRYLTQRSLEQVERQLRQLAADDQYPLSIPTSSNDDLGPVMAALNDYVASVRRRVERLKLQKKELDIQMRFANAERRNTEAIIHSITDAVLVIDPNGDLLLANSSAERLFDFQHTPLSPRPVGKLIRDESLVHMLRDVGRVDPRWQRREIEYCTSRGGRRQTFKITLSAVLDKMGNSGGLVAVFHDITREREIAQIKTDFVSAVSHELRTPLSSIKAYTEMLMDDEAGDESSRREFYRIIESETDRLGRLVDNILNISRIESGVVEINRQAVPANDVILDVLGMLAPQATANGLTLDHELADRLPSIWGDRDLLYQAVMNVVGNAIKYTPEGGRVCVTSRLEDEGRCMAIEIMDNGIGIRSEDLPRLFDKFFRTRQSASIANGTGLGLSLVKEIVETVHQGEISVASESGVGTTMTLRFPLLKGTQT